VAYIDIAALTRDTDFNDRVAACYATETPGHIGEYPTVWASSHAWDMAAQPGFGDAYSYAIQTHPDDPDYRPGADPAVITDGMILSAVQSLLPSIPEPPVEVTVTALEPATASIADDDFEGHIRGTGFTEETVIVWNGADEPTRFVDATDVWTTVVPSVVTAPTTLQVTVRNGDETVEPALDFVWTDTP